MENEPAEQSRVSPEMEMDNELAEIAEILVHLDIAERKAREEMDNEAERKVL